MTVAQFEAVRLLLNLSEERVSAARAVLVDGETLQAVGARYGWSRQAVDDAVGIAWKTLGRYQAAQHAEAGASAVLPRGWDQATFTAPRAVIEKMREQVAEALAVYEQGPATRLLAPRKRPIRRKRPATPADSSSVAEGRPGQDDPIPRIADAGDSP